MRVHVEKTKNVGYGFETVITTLRCLIHFCSKVKKELYVVFIWDYVRKRRELCARSS